MMILRTLKTAIRQTVTEDLATATVLSVATAVVPRGGKSVRKKKRRKKKRAPTSKMAAKPGSKKAKSDVGVADWELIARKDYNLKTKYNDAFPQLSKADYEAKQLCRAGKVLQLKATMEELLSQPKVVKRMLLDKGHVSWTWRYDTTGKKTKMVPNLFLNRVEGQLRLFQIGERYPAHQIAAMVGTSRSNYQKNVYQPGGQEALIISAPYKNDLDSVLVAQKGTDPIFMKDLGGLLVIDRNGTPTVTVGAVFGDNETLFIYGVGGSADDQGVHCPDVGKQNVNNYNVVIPSCQAVGPGTVNKALGEIAYRKGVVAVFSEYQNFNPGYTKPSADMGTDGDLVQFLGYYYFADKNEPQEDKEGLIKSLGKVSDYILRYSMFRTRPYNRFHLKRLFTTKEWTDLRTREESHGVHHQVYQHVPVDDELKQAVPLKMQIPIEDSFHWSKAKIGFEETVEYCVGGDALDKFAKQEEPGEGLQPPTPTGVGVVETANADSTTDGATEKDLKGTKGTIAQCIDSVVLITQAGFQRFAGGSLTTENVETAQAKLLEDTALPLVHRMSAHPLGNRGWTLPMSIYMPSGTATAENLKRLKFKGSV